MISVGVDQGQSSLRGIFAGNQGVRTCKQGQILWKAPSEVQRCFSRAESGDDSAAIAQRSGWRSRAGLSTMANGREGQAEAAGK
jgi:hypothetical protein